MSSILLRLVRKIVMLAFLGVGAVLFAGMLFSLLGGLFVLAAAGFLLWMPLHSLILRNKMKRRCCWQGRAGVGLRTRDRWRSIGVNAAKGRCAVGTSSRRWARRSFVFVTEATSGALIGCLILLIRNPAPSFAMLALGIVGGGTLGVWVAFQQQPAQAENKLSYY